MAASVDIAGAVAPAAPGPSKSGARTGGAPRGASTTAKAKCHGDRASAGAASGPDAADAPGAFDAQLDAALPDACGSGKAKRKAAATDGAPQPASAGPDSDDQARDQVATGAVLTPWTFVQPADVTQGVAGDGNAPPSTAEGSAGLESVGSESATSSITPDVGRDPRSGPGAAAPTVQQSAEVPEAIADSAAAKPAAENVAPTLLAVVPKQNAAVEQRDQIDQVQGVQSSVAEKRSTSDTAAVRDVPVEQSAAASSTPAASDTKPAVVTQPATTVARPTSASTSQPASADSRVTPSQSADVPVAGAATAAVSTVNTAATPQHAAVDETAAVVSPKTAAAVVSTAAPATATSGRGNPSKGSELPVKGRSAAAHVQQRHGFQTSASREADKGQRGGAAVDAPANVGAVDDQRRNGSAADTELAASKAAGVTDGPDTPTHEAPPLASATRAIHPTMSAMPVGDGVRQVAVEGTPLPEASTASPTDVPDADTPHRLVQSLRMQFLRGGGDAIVQLRPEHLGQVTVSLRVEQGSVAARITAADPVVAEWLQAHQDSLRDGLQANGLTLDRLSIDRDGRSPDRRERREQPARQRFRQSAEPQSTFELTI